MIAPNILILSRVVRTFITSCRSYRSHYDVLEVTPKATQKDIKTAYYRLSKLYHPDKSNDVESAKKFRAIKEAYEILGNKNLRKIYDNEAKIAEPVRKFYRSRERNASPYKTGKTPHYDYDTWYQNHYGFQESKYNGNADVSREKTTQQTRTRGKASSVTEIMGLMLGVFIFFYFISVDIESLDNPKTTKREEKKDTNTTNG